jgi:hypothetical protein
LKAVSIFAPDRRPLVWAGFLDRLSALNQSAPVNAVNYGHDQTDDRKQRGHQLDRNGIGFFHEKSNR